MSWTATLDDLLTGRGQPENNDLLPGAQLVVDYSGQEVFRAALARHWRRDPNQPNLIWIRPIVATEASPTGLPAFDPAATRRRALEVTQACVDHRGLNLVLATGQHARIEPARNAELATLQLWDTWMTTLPRLLRLQLDALDTES